jgi:dolichol kinase
VFNAFSPGVEVPMRDTGEPAPELGAARMRLAAAVGAGVGARTLGSMERRSVRERARAGGVAGLVVALFVLPPFMARLGPGGGVAATLVMAAGVTAAVVVILGVTRYRGPDPP